MFFKVKPQAALFMFGLPYLLCFVGCGNDGLCKVTGTVTLDGVPLADTTIMFTSTTAGLNASGRTNQDGVYLLQTLTGKIGGGTPKGNYVVTFSKLEIVWDGKSYVTNSSNVRHKDERARESLPNLYTSSLSSPFKVDVDKKMNQFDFDMKSKP